MPDQEAAAARREQEQPGTTRRGMLRGAAGLGAAGLAAGVLAATQAGAASAATAAASKPDEGQAAQHQTAEQAAQHDEPLVAHVRDARTGVVDLYTGTRHIRFTDPQLAARLARAVR